MFHVNSIKILSMFGVAIVISGCASSGGSVETKSGQIRITSEPAGAIVYADAVELGATPLAIVPGEHFNSGFVGFSYRYYGKLSIKKDGCKPWATEVNDAILARDVNAKLDCDPNFQPAAMPVPASGGTIQPASKPRLQDDSAERLERLESLHNKKLITDEEYRMLRARVLEKL